MTIDERLEALEGAVTRLQRACFAMLNDLILDGRNAHVAELAVEINEDPPEGD